MRLERVAQHLGESRYAQELHRGRNASVTLLAALLAACSTELVDGDIGTYFPPNGKQGAGGTEAIPPAVGSTPGGGGGTTQPDAGGAGYDPSITFDWPESDPTLVCLSGTYSGQFSCQLNAGGPFPSGPITGPVSFTLKPAASGEFLEIENGLLRGTASGLIEFASDLIGKLDCTNDRFRADAINGTFFGGTFAGTLDGKLDRSTQTLIGTWSLALPLAPPCVGPFSLVRLP